MHRGSISSRSSSRQQTTHVQSRLADPTAAAPARRMGVRTAAEANIQIDTALKNGLFRVFPTKKMMNSRHLPDELKGRPKIIGNEEQVSALFRYTKKIATQFFSASALKNLFPSHFTPDNASRLSFMSASSRSSISGSRIPVRRSSVTPAVDLKSEGDTSLASGFKVLSNLILDNRQKATELTDFILLYIATAMAIGTEETISNALTFLEKFLKLGSIRAAEANILFAVMLRLCEVSRSFRKPVVSSLAKLATIEGTLVDRLENGTTHRNAELSGLCTDVLKTMGRTNTATDRFGSISDEADELSAIESLNKFVDTLEDNGQPSDMINFIRNITSVMSRFPQSVTILERSAACLDSVLPFSPAVPFELIYEILSVCLTILSGEVFLEGPDSFDAVEALQSLQTTIFTKVPPNTVAEAMIGLVAQAQGPKLEATLKLLDAHVADHDIPENILRRIAENMTAFHPGQKLPDYLQFTDVLQIDEIDPISVSLERLCNPDTFSSELASILARSPDGSFEGYPEEITEILQCAWILLHNSRPANCSDETYSTTLAIKADMDSITDETVLNSKYGPAALLERLESLFEE